MVENEDLRRTILQAAPGIIGKMIEKANDGSYQHAKFLFDLAGIELQEPAEDEEEGDLAGLLLKELGELRAEGSADTR